MTPRDPFQVDAPEAILHKDTGKRLDAIVRRHGGKPTPVDSSKMVLPPVGKRQCEGQTAIEDETEAAS